MVSEFLPRSLILVIIRGVKGISYWECFQVVSGPVSDESHSVCEAMTNCLPYIMGYKANNMDI